MNHFSPHLEILPAPQRALWNELSEVSREFVLYRGTALALHLAHRNSVDFDLFGSRALDLAQIEQGISFLKGANIIQRDKNTLSAIVNRGGPVKVSFFGGPNLPRLSAAVVAKDNGLGIDGERVAKHGSKCGSYNLRRTWRRSEGAREDWLAKHGPEKK
jgi:Nucleotidyl transferase AbiEii toxin, Type IV TA system